MKKTAQIIKMILPVILFSVVLLSGCAKKEEQITSLSGLSGKSVSVQSGTIFGAEIKECEALSGVEVVYAPFASDAFTMMLGGKTDGYVTDNVAAQELLRASNGVIILPEAVSESYYGIAMPRGSELKEKINEALAEFSADGTLLGLSEKWLGDDDDAKVIDSAVRKDIPNAAGTLLCVENSELDAICYQDSLGRATGYDIELVLLLSHKLGYNVKFQETVFDDLIPTVAAGKADLAVSGINITTERQQMADFSDPYLDVSTVVMVRDVTVDTLGQSRILSLQNRLRRVFIEDGRWKQLLKAVGITALLTVSAVVLGLLLGMLFFLADYSESRVWKPVVKFIDRTVTFLPLSVRLMVWYYIILFGGSGAWNLVAAVCTLSMGFGDSVYACIAGSISAEDAGQALAARSLGYSKMNTLRRILLPQAIPGIAGSLESMVVFLIRDTTLVEFIAVMDVTATLDGIGTATQESVLLVLVSVAFYVLFEMAAVRVVRAITKRMVRERKNAEEIKESIGRGKI